MKSMRADCISFGCLLEVAQRSVCEDVLQKVRTDYADDLLLCLATTHIAAVMGKEHAIKCISVLSAILVLRSSFLLLFLCRNIRNFTIDRKIILSRETAVLAVCCGTSLLLG